MNKILATVVVLVVAVAGFMVFKSDSKTLVPAERTPAANEILISNFAYSSNKLTVKKGTTVTWVNLDTARHDITPDQPSDNFKTSELLNKDESYSFTFSEVGNYGYHCSPHPYMKGIVEVTE